VRSRRYSLRLVGKRREPTARKISRRRVVQVPQHWTKPQTPPTVINNLSNKWTLVGQVASQVRLLQASQLHHHRTSSTSFLKIWLTRCRIVKLLQMGVLIINKIYIWLRKKTMSYFMGQKWKTLNNNSHITNIGKIYSLTMTSNNNNRRLTRSPTLLEIISLKVYQRIKI